MVAYPDLSMCIRLELTSSPVRLSIVEEKRNISNESDCNGIRYKLKGIDRPKVNDKTMY